MCERRGPRGRPQLGPDSRGKVPVGGLGDEADAFLLMNAYILMF